MHADEVDTDAVPLAKGMPAEDYPFERSVYRWLDGESATIECITDLPEAATDLARFVAALQRVDSHGGPRRPGKQPSGRQNGTARPSGSTETSTREIC
jgi:aminoglycoside phosphotransferase (APT) family kinase protein